ncbi:MAG: hypothetical protein KJN64_06770 [Ignavibacteria bacterium]|nr:hypothetical protein [Ignavibacteria bacterium]MBT8394568.1 hypothetical protein [Bacteroidia bacterium]NNJ51978.1 hypothetical protein [Ignavibacteriaceae bacterium]MBT8381285.1 hypothetical protein [Ignavibacteria bacterium]MBT8392637.1 hypothetical protein [Ignavibacteria bacterium]
MKSILTLITITFLFFGCQESSNITDPLENTTKTTFNKYPEANYDLILLPTKAPEWQDSSFTVSKEINGDFGGFIYLNKYYIDASGNQIDIEARLTIPAHAFQGTKTITITVDDNFAALRFSPSMTFTKNLKLYTYFSGLHLNGIKQKSLDFVYIANGGSIELLKKKGVKIFPKWGILQVNSAELPHFSRFGWVRKQASGI